VCVVVRFCHGTVRGVLQEVVEELLRDKEYDPDNNVNVELVKTVADEVHAKLKNSSVGLCLLELLSKRASLQAVLSKKLREVYVLTFLANHGFRPESWRLCITVIRGCRLRFRSIGAHMPKKYPNTKIMISQKYANITVLNFAHLFRRQLCKSVLLCAVFA